MIFVFAAYALGFGLAMECMAEVVWDGLASMTGEDLVIALVVAALWPIFLVALLVGLVIREAQK